VPLVAGVAELSAEGIESTLAPANRAVENQIDNRRASETHAPGGPRVASRRPEGNERSNDFASVHSMAARYAALFDPQTSGGLLVGLPPDEVQHFVKILAAQQSIPVAVIGTVVEVQSDGPRLRIV